MQPRTVSQIIDQAILENRRGENLLYISAAVFVVVGVVVLIVGAYQSEGLLSLSGGVASGLFIPAVRQAEKIRSQNLMIRMLETSLINARTANEAADAVRQVFLKVFGR